jgi:endonuclease III
MSKGKDSTSTTTCSPYPTHSRPTYEECSTVVRLLSNLHGEPTKGSETMPVLDSLVRTILSQNTTDKLSRQAFQNLKRDYKDYLSILHAKDGDVGE